MKTIWKFKLIVTDEQQIEMPEGAAPLFVAPSGHLEILLWALVDSESPRVLHRFAIRGTGHPVPGDGVYVGSVIAQPFVWHVFDRGA